MRESWKVHACGGKNARQKVQGVDMRYKEKDTEKACKIRRESVTVKRKCKADKISQKAEQSKLPTSHMYLPRNSKLSI